MQLPAIDNILATGKDYLGDSSALERSFSLMKRAKTDWCNRLQSHTVSQLMMIKLDGPDLDSFDTQPPISRWLKAAPRCRQPSSLPYGPRQARAQSESEIDSSDSETD